MTTDLLTMAQDDREEEALSALLANLLDESAPKLCSSLEKCQPSGCGRKPGECAA